MQSPEEIYAELREKVALAFEIQGNIFLDDENLHAVVMQIFHSLVELKRRSPIIDYNIQVQRTQFGVTANLLIKPQVVDIMIMDILNALQTVVQQNNLNTEPDGINKFKIQINKKSVTIKLAK